MRTLAIVLLFWSVHAFGLESPDAPPPHGMWACLYEAATMCEWENHEKPPECILVNLEVAESACFDLRSTPYTVYDCQVSSTDTYIKRDRIVYSGPEGGMWTLVGGSLGVAGIEPGSGKLRVIASIWGGYIIQEGSCTNIEKKKTEKKADSLSKDKGTRKPPAND